jgi:phosphate:Na+ symporter
MDIVKAQEAIGDVIDVKLLQLLVEKNALKVDLTAEGKEEITELYTHILREIELLTEALREMDPRKASLLLEQEERFCGLERAVEFRHWERITKRIPESKLTHTIHMELMDGLRQIHEYDAAIARAIHALSLEQNGDQPEAAPQQPAP